jgi:hypothetical protein
MTEVPQYEFNDDDGFGGSHNSRLIRGIRVSWNRTQHWHDRDGVAVPSEMFLVSVREFLQRWKDGRPEIIDAKPLPRADDLNSAIPVSDWQIGIDGQPTPPWQHTVAFYFINLASGETYTFASSTVGAHIAYDRICDAVTNMRALRGAKVSPLVHLSERPMKTNFGPRTRPHLEIVGWKYPGEDLSPAPQPDPTPPSTASPSTVPPPTSQPTQPMSNPTPRQPKPSVNVRGNGTLAAMGDVDPVSMAEELNDKIHWK